MYYDASKEHQPIPRPASPSKEHPNKAKARAKKRELLRKAKLQEV